MSTNTLLPPAASTSLQPETGPSKRIAFGDILLLCLILLLSAALRFYHLGAASLWSDEIFSRYYPDVFGLHFLLTDGLSKEPTPPTYYLLLRGWIAVWGDSATALRSLSAVAGILCVPVAYLLGTELGGRRQALASALLFALCPTSIYFAQETRVYALFMLAASLVLWAAAVFQRDGKSVTAAACYCVFGTFCLYLHATGVLFVVSCGAAVWFSLLAGGKAARSALLRWSMLNVLVLCLGVPYFLHTLHASKSGGLDWMPRAGLHQLVYCAAQVLGGILTPYPWPGLILAAAGFAALAFSLLSRRPSRIAAVTMLGAPCVYIALVLIVSIGRPILLPRILAWVVVPLCVLGGRQLLLAGRARIVLLFTLVAIFGAGLFYQISTISSNKEPWREITQTFGSAFSQSDLVVLSPNTDPMVLRYYAPQVTNVRLWDAGLRPSIMNEAAQRLQILPITEGEINQAIASRHSVWIVAHSFDLNRVNALRSHQPSTLFQVWRCGKAPCVAVAGWLPQR